MPEAAQVQLKGTIEVHAQDTTHPPQVPGFAVGGQSHDLVLVAKVWEPEMLRDGRIENAEGMWKINPSINGH